MKLQLKHLAPYLPYGLKGVNTHRGIVIDMLGLQTDLDVVHNHGKTPIKYIQPILRPLSDLTKEIEQFGGDKGELIAVQRGHLDADLLRGRDLIKLFELHFDVFGLIEKGLAIDIGKLNK